MIEHHGFASVVLTYDGGPGGGRVATQTIQGAGKSDKSTLNASAAGTFKYTYHRATDTTGADPVGYNLWRTHTVEQQLDPTTGAALPGETHTFTNFAGQTILTAFEPDTDGTVATGGNAPQWRTFSERDGAGRVILSAAPSAVASFDKSEADLAVDVHDDAGLVQRFVYVTEEPDTEDAATASQAGDIKGYLKEILIQQGDGGGSADSAIRQQSLQYFLFDLDENIAKLANETVYREENTWSSGAAAGAITTSYSYSNWATALPGQIVTTLPAVDTAQNGSGLAAMLTDTYDQHGRLTSHIDGDGYTHTWQYDDATGTVVRQEVDDGGLELTTRP